MLLRPADAGGPYTPWFARLNAELRREGPGIPALVLDLDAVEHNFQHMRRMFPADVAWRIVVKSLPCVSLLEHLMRRAGTRRLMLFHQPFIRPVARAFPDADLLLGKPMPVNAAAALYENLGVTTGFNPARQLRWLIDTPERLTQYRALARGRGLRLRVAIELDVGLHRGGVSDTRTLDQMLREIEKNPVHLELAGFMGYDAHVAAAPERLQGRVFRSASRHYRRLVAHAARRFPKLLREEGLVFNGGGSKTFMFHARGSVVDELSAGSCMVMPSDFDTPRLAGFRAALFVAAPVLKVSRSATAHAGGWLDRLRSRRDPNQARAIFLYGGKWMALPIEPPGLRRNPHYGPSTNQELLNGSERTALEPDDHVFLRPTQSESLMLQLGDLLVLRDQRIVARWPVLPSTERG